MRSCDARTCILNIIGGQLLERWPPTFMEKFFGNREFSYKDRMDMGTFLYGNMRDINLVYCAVREQVGSDPTHHDHMRRWLADIASGKYDERYYYFDVLLADWYFLGGALNADRWLPSPYARVMNAWELECQRVRGREGRWPSLMEQCAFVGSGSA
jgi:hypothetical protein